MCSDSKGPASFHWVAHSGSHGGLTRRAGTQDHRCSREDCGFQKSRQRQAVEDSQPLGAQVTPQHCW